MPNKNNSARGNQFKSRPARKAQTPATPSVPPSNGPKTNKEPKPDVVSMEGKIVEALPNAMFQVMLDNGHTLLGYISGKMRKNFIRILPGDRVIIELSVYDLTRGRITYRYR